MPCRKSGMVSSRTPYVFIIHVFYKMIRDECKYINACTHTYMHTYTYVHMCIHMVGQSGQKSGIIVTIYSNIW